MFRIGIFNQAANYHYVHKKNKNNEKGGPQKCVCF